MIEQSNVETNEARVPDHVPSELVRRFDFRTGLGSCPHQVVAELHKGPRIFFSPVSHQVRTAQAAGTWVLTKAEDIRYVLQNPELFTSAAPRAHAMGETWRLIPLELDPPEHGKFRSLLNPQFAPKRLKLLDGKIRDWAIELIERVVANGECDFIPAFAEIYPVGIFLDLLGLPRSYLAMCRRWANGYVHDRARRGQMMAEIKQFLSQEIEQRRAEPGTDDLLTYVTRMQIDGRNINDEEAIGVCFLLFIGGLDTVTSSLSFQFRYLAENADQQERLRADTSLVPDAVEELFRAFPVVTTARLAARDTQLAGVTIRKGDMVTTSTLLSTRDPDEFPNPSQVDFERRPYTHNAFSFGPHRCLGSHLARREMVIAVEEWVRRVPSFRVKSGSQIEALGGGVIGLNTLPLEWQRK
jgi:cytochrome P450